MACTVNLPGDGKVLRTLLVVPESADSRPCVSGNILAHVVVFIGDHSKDEVRVVLAQLPPLPLSYRVRPEVMGELLGQSFGG